MSADTYFQYVTSNLERLVKNSIYVSTLLDTA